MIGDYTNRRSILRVVGIGVAVSVAGCSESDSAEDPESSGGATESNSGTESLTSDDESSGGGTAEDSTAQTEPGQEQLYEQNESDAEVEYENILSSFSPDWIEMETPEEQFPEENFDTETFPTLELFTTDMESAHVDPYSPNEAFYLSWKEDESIVFRLAGSMRS